QAAHARSRRTPYDQLRRRGRPPRLAAVGGLHHRLCVDCAGRCPAGGRRGARRHRHATTTGTPPHGGRSRRGRTQWRACPAVRAGPRPSGLGRRAALAYCLPGVRSRVVVSEGTLTALADAEVAAILTHERAHLRARHDLVLEAFTAVHAAFPRLVRSANALGAVQLLVELLADDAAVRAAGRTPLARALVACASGRAPSGALAVGGPSTVLRVRRLSGRGNSAVLSAAAYLAAAAVLVVPTVALAVPWLTQLQRLFIA
ncbi:LOW QUALITY PROTEIN: conserved hypothetical transmembrane protein, partial [Mycobacterium tuberculosis variant africanum K85]